MSASSIQERDYFVAWIQFFICNALGGAVAGGIAGAVVGTLLGSPQAHPKLFVLATGGAGFIASIPVSYFFFRLFVSRLWFRFSTGSAHGPTLSDSST